MWCGHNSVSAKCSVAVLVCQREHWGDSSTPSSVCNYDGLLLSLQSVTAVTAAVATLIVLVTIIGPFSASGSCTTVLPHLKERRGSKDKVSLNKFSGFFGRKGLRNTNN